MRIIAFLCLTGCFFYNTANAQRYNFTHYDIENGLIQSQVNRLAQDNAHRLWMGTLGGAARFDGKDYYNISKANGLNNNFVYAVFTDKSGAVWFGTHRGLSLFKNQKVYNFPPPAGMKNTWVTQIAQDKKGDVWIILNNHLFKVQGKALELVSFGDNDHGVTSVMADKQGKLYAALYRKGIYSLNDHTWQPYVNFADEADPIHVMKFAFDREDAKTLYILSLKGLFTARGGMLNPLTASTMLPSGTSFLSFDQDADNNLWIGTNNGAYYLKQGKAIHFTAKNGLTDNPVTDVFKDADNNLWLATSGSGIFKFEGDDHVTYDRSNGLTNNQVVMGIAPGRNGEVILGTDAGLLSYANGLLSPMPFKNGGIDERRIQGLFTDSKNNLWIGADAAWKYDGSKYEMIKGTEGGTIISIGEDTAGTIWLATPTGCMYYQNGQLTRLQGSSAFTTALLPIGRDSMLIGTQEGALLAVNKKLVPGFRIGAIARSSILGMAKYKNLVFFGSDDRGIFIWDIPTGKIRNYGEKQGLKSNAIYSLVNDDKGILWVGTGRGVNRLKVDTKAVSATVLKSINANEPVVESNQNAALFFKGKIFIGNTKGLTIYNTDIKMRSGAAPYVMIQNARLFEDNKSPRLISLNSKNDTCPQLSADQNHLAITFFGVHLNNPQSVKYQYKLTGLERDFSMPVSTNVVEYPSLPPGRYTFEVKAINADGQQSKTTAKFHFEIVPPFYKTALFQIVAAIFIMLLIIAIQSLWHHNKKQRQLAIEAIKREEKIKIRQQTAEDFHDDLGNKLTRITVLSEILNVKIESDKPEQRNLVEQIKQNAAALYNGTKDILWALDPKSDNLYETLKHIEEIGIEIFQDTPVAFTFDNINEDLELVKLTMEYNRNITMIFKESLNNVLKHADATKAVLKIIRIDKNIIGIMLTDNGKGFDADADIKGHGIKNIQTRAKRFNGYLQIISAPGAGTTVALEFTINTKTTR
ncbi:two-component regulator propeller domain-containing protein [Mucilaginibacter gynuensis]|uniref:Two-component regulator propeller domain-containing protein n=1 Tax=Mucilaginibacter gynuensis TaxID=1302236 RepID=A0ABP8HEB2_9SPHI